METKLHIPEVTERIKDWPNTNDEGWQTARCICAVNCIDECSNCLYDMSNLVEFLEWTKHND